MILGDLRVGLIPRLGDRTRGPRPESEILTCHPPLPAFGAVGYFAVSVGSVLNAASRGDTTLGGQIAFPGFLVVALWRQDVARTAGMALLAGIVVFGGGFAVGPAVMDLVGFDLVWVVANLLVAGGCILFGNAVHMDTDVDMTNRVAPVA